MYEIPFANRRKPVKPSMIYTDEQRQLLDVWRDWYARLHPWLVGDAATNAATTNETAAGEARRLTGLIVQLGCADLEAEMNAAIITAWRLAPHDPCVAVWYGWYLLRRQPLEGETILKQVMGAAAAPPPLRVIARKWLDAYERSTVEPHWMALAAPELTQIGLLSPERAAMLTGETKRRRH